MIHFGKSIAAGIVLAASISIPSSASAQTSSLPGQWTATDVGAPSQQGSAAATNGVFTMTGGGYDIWNDTDEFHFVYQRITGDGQITARVASLNGVHDWSKAGVMIRAALTGPSAHAGLFASSERGWAFQRRREDGGLSTHTPHAGSAPGWVRLVRRGNVVSAHHSDDGSYWTLVGSETLATSADVYIGLAVTSHNVDAAATATFTDVSVTGSSVSAGALPAPWATRDIGDPALGGAASLTSGTFTVTGAGYDIWADTDEFRFVYRAVTGDTQIIARVAALDGAHVWSKAGVMIRGALTGPSAHASLFASSDEGWAFQRRQYDGGQSTHTGQAGSAPGWVRLVRQRDLITAYHSRDGADWTLVDSEVIPMSATVYVGLAVTSHAPEAKATATFSNVSITAPNSGNAPPVVSLTTPLAGQTFAAPATVTLSAAATDPDGLVGSVRFFANNVLVGTATGPSFSVNWANVPAGTYSLTAVATDDAGMSATSAAVLVTVNAATSAPKPTRAVFNPSADHDRGVTSYAVELRRASDSVTAVPVATRNIAKPTPVNGEITVDISTLVDPLPAGSYYGVIVAIGPGGSVASSPSAAFVK